MQKSSPADYHKSSMLDGKSLERITGLSRRRPFQQPIIDEQDTVEDIFATNRKPMHPAIPNELLVMRTSLAKAIPVPAMPKARLLSDSANLLSADAGVMAKSLNTPLDAALGKQPIATVPQAKSQSNEMTKGPKPTRRRQRFISTGSYISAFQSGDPEKNQSELSDVASAIVAVSPLSVHAPLVRDKGKRKATMFSDEEESEDHKSDESAAADHQQFMQRLTQVANEASVATTNTTVAPFWRSDPAARSDTVSLGLQGNETTTEATEEERCGAHLNEGTTEWAELSAQASKTSRSGTEPLNNGKSSLSGKIPACLKVSGKGASTSSLSHANRTEDHKSSQDVLEAQVMSDLAYAFTLVHDDSPIIPTATKQKECIACCEPKSTLSFPPRPPTSAAPTNPTSAMLASRNGQSPSSTP